MCAMTLKSHLIVGAVGAILAYPHIGGYRSLLFFVASFLIDADHYLDYLWRTRDKKGIPQDWRPRSMFKFYDEDLKNLHDPRKLSFSLLHTVEAFLVVYMLAIFLNYEFFITVLGGMAFHTLFDVLWAVQHKVIFGRPFSILEYLLRKQSMKKKGLDPDEFSQDMFTRSQAQFTKTNLPLEI